MKNNSLTNDQKEQLAYLEVRLFNARSNYEIEKTMVDIIKLIPNDYDFIIYSHHKNLDDDKSILHKKIFKTF